MSASTLDAQSRGSRSPRIMRWAILAGGAAFVTMVAVKAFMQAFDQEDFPEALLVKVELMPAIFPVHMFTGALALVLLPLALLLRPWPRWHRLAGRVAMADIVVAGLTAYPVALIAPVTAWSAAGFAAQATVWLAFLAIGLWNIRRGNVARHRMFMLLMAATASGAIVFRVFLASWALLGQGRHFALVYACVAWVAWLLPLGVTLVYVKRAGGLRTIPR